ncbi:hypothetical protein CesoFtcFv8_005003 [Champsocephalus esox]|uniref:Uncharacterized protein n=1 Tax=Champsocephalus esox TaxID=159716 RepID=A0AAN8CNR3_9TELE|nr:hypothetical protein CesoFtcFv8_005003 [Champsocephalus esox]
MMGMLKAKLRPPKKKMRVGIQVVTLKMKRQKASLWKASRLQTPVKACLTSQQMSSYTNPTRCLRKKPSLWLSQRRTNQKWK